MITIVGAGCIGNYLAYNLAKNGQEVRVIEEHLKVGKPVQCTGLTTHFLEDVVKLRNDLIMNKMKKVRVIAPNGKITDIPLKRPEIVLNRCEFDNYLMEMAEKEGAKFLLGRKYINFDGKKVQVNNEYLDTNALIGADGPGSIVARTNNILGKREFWTASQATIKGNWEKDTFTVWFGSMAPGFFAWCVPENEEIARVGLAVKVNVTGYFDTLVKDKGKILERQGGLIPIYNKNIVTEKNNVYLVGDAAMQVKATTGGGIIPGMLAAEELSKAIIDKESYEKRWKKRIGKSLDMHLRLRKMLDKFSDKNYDKLIEMMNKESFKKILENADREFPSKLMMELLVKEPGLLKFAVKAI